MTRFAVLFLAFIPAAFAAEIAPPPHAAGVVSFTEVTQAAALDSAGLPSHIGLQTRYLDARGLNADDRSAVAYQVNALSREGVLTPPRMVTPWLMAIQLDTYRWDASQWENLAGENVHYCIKVTIQGQAVTKTRQVLRKDAYGRQFYVTEQYAEEKAASNDILPAPWLPPAAIAELTRRTGSKTPIIRGDLFLNRTGAQVNRKGFGYYDWLGLKSRKDAESLGGLDRAKAIELYRELAAIVPISGVGPNNRQVFRFATLTGSWWETRDVKDNTGTRNAVSHLLAEFTHDAEEIVFTLPNGLPGFYLSDAKGVQQDTAPDFIASDHRSTNNDRRVHPGYSCIACHTDGGLRPIRDYSRKIYNPETGLALGALSLDPAKARRLESVYLGPLDRAYRRDASDFAEAIQAASGLKPADLSIAFEKLWSRYLDEPVTLERASLECGVTPEILQKRLRAYAAAKKLVDPVLAVYLIPDPPPVRREHFEERFGLLMLIVEGANP